MKEALDLTPKSLEVSIGRYKKDLTTYKVDEDLLGFKLEGYKISGLNEVDEVERLYRLQLSRIEIGVMAEKKVGGINKLMAVEVSTALELLRRSHEIKMDQGQGGGRDLGTVTVRPELMVEVKEKYGDDMLSALQDPESRNKVLSIAKSLAQFSELPDLSKVLDVGDD